MKPIIAPDQPQATVYFDGSCPLCQAEISYYRKQAGSDAICFLDVSDEKVVLPNDVTRQQVMQRFHVRARDGSLISGAAAFVGLWGLLPKWRWASRVGKSPVILPILEFGYRLFLPVRPTLSQLFARIRPAK